MVQHQGLKAKWLLQFPEIVAAVEIYYMVWGPVRVEWRDYGNGEIGYDWKPSPDWKPSAGWLAQVQRTPGPVQMERVQR